MNLPYQPDFSNDVAVVTGAGGVLCSMFAQALVHCGAKVVLLDHTEANVRAVEHELRALGGEVLGVVADVTDANSLLHARDEMRAAREAADAAEARVQELEAELHRVNGLIRCDQLTGALNRRGLEDRFAREAHQAHRQNQPLSLVMLDLDDFRFVAED